MFMKRSLLLLIPLLVSGMFAFNSCEKEVVGYSPDLPDLIPEKSFFATVDGVEFVDTIFWASESVVDNRLSIKAIVDGDFPIMTFNLPADIAPGTYELGGLTSANKTVLSFGTLQNEQFEALAGTLNISTHDTDANFMRATFSFTAVASFGNTSLVEFDVADGEFVVSYQ